MGGFLRSADLNLRCYYFAVGIEIYALFPMIFQSFAMRNLREVEACLFVLALQDTELFLVWFVRWENRYLEDWRETRRKFYVESVWENLCSRQHKFSLTLFNWLFSFQRFNFYSNHAIKKKLSHKLVATKQSSDELCNKIDSIEPMKHNYRNKNVSQLGTTFLGAVTLTFFSLLITLFIKSWK